MPGELIRSEPRLTKFLDGDLARGPVKIGKMTRRPRPRTARPEANRDWLAHH